MNLHERIQEERNRVSGELVELKSLNESDGQLLKELQENYYAAIVTSDEKEIDKINDEIKEVSSRITRRNEMIEALSDKNNPVIQAMIVEQLKQWGNELFILEEQANEKAKELGQLKENLLNGLLEMNGMYRQASNLRYWTNRYKVQLSEVGIKKVGLPNHSLDNLSPICHQIRALLIQERQVFK
jgi:DNA anti-recombination protein RmuC